jgi:hypothetical protein
MAKRNDKTKEACTVSMRTSSCTPCQRYEVPSYQYLFETHYKNYILRKVAVIKIIKCSDMGLIAFAVYRIQSREFLNIMISKRLQR